MTALTPRQQEIYDWICKQLKAGFPPTYRQIGAQFGIASPNGVASQLKAIEKKGYLEHEPKLGRTLRLTKAAKRAAGGIPIFDDTESLAALLND